MDLEKRPGASFRAIFKYALMLGTLSHRRVYFEALKYEKERGGGHISPFGFSTFTAATAVTDVKSIEVPGCDTILIFQDYSVNSYLSISGWSAAHFPVDMLQILLLDLYATLKGLGRLFIIS